jgi:hypothetical protein
VKELNEARVIAVGPGALDKDGKRIQPSVAAGDKVLIPQVCRGSHQRKERWSQDRSLTKVAVRRKPYQGWRGRILLVQRS